MMGNRTYIVRVGDLASQALNTVFFMGTPDESTSGRSYRQGALEGNPRWHRAQRFIDWLFSPWEKEHCRKAYEGDIERMEFRLAKHRAVLTKVQ